MNQVENKWEKQGDEYTFQQIKTPISITKWGSRFDKYNEKHARRLMLSDYYWPTNTDYSVAGTFYSPNFHYIELRISRCTNSSEWKSNDEITNVLNKTRITMALINTIIDMDDYDTPIKSIIDDGLYWDLVSGFNKKTDIFIRQNKAEFEDNFIQIGVPKEKEFYQMANTVDYFERESSEGEVLALYFRYDKISDIYSRQIYSVGTFLGEIGGFFEAALLIGSLLISIFSQTLYKTSLIKQIYQIDTWQEKEMVEKQIDKKLPEHNM